VGLWLAIVLVTLSFHELWRDEVRAFSIARDAPSWLGLFSALENEGHPVLWYAVLRGLYGIFASTAVLPFASVTIAGAAVAVLVRYAPLPAHLVLLFVFGALPLYEYSVMARSYGLGMLLLFLAALLFPERRRRPLVLALVLALLANTSLYVLILSVLLASVGAWDVVAGERPARWRDQALACAIVAAGVGLALHTAWPTAASHVASPGRLSPAAVLGSMADNLADPAHGFRQILYPLKQTRALVLVLAIVGLVCWWPLLASTAVAMLGIAAVSDLVLQSSYRHQGLLVVWLLAMYWILLARDPAPARASRLKDRCLRVSLHVGLPLLLLLVVRQGLGRIKTDVLRPVSATAAFARFLDERADYRDAILIGEPDYYLEAMPYYRDNRIFRPRSGRFESVARFTTASREEMSLGELLASAERVAAEERTPVLIALANDRGRRDGGEAPWGFRGRFTWTPEEVAAFRARTVLVGEFDGINESYAAYALERAVDPEP
jgi:hypothetical protein